MQRLFKKFLIIIVVVFSSSKAYADNTANREITIFGYDYVKITDNEGNTNKKLSDIAAMHIPNVDVQYNANQNENGPGFCIINAPADKMLTIEGDAGEGGGIEIKDTSQNQVSIASIKYQLLANYKWQLKVMRTSAELFIDKNNDGVFTQNEETASTYTSYGNNVDTEPPKTTINIKVTVSDIEVDLSATDNVAVKKIMYFVDNEGKAYSGPLHFPNNKEIRFKAVSEDTMGNLSAIIDTVLNQKLNISEASGIKTLSWWYPSDGYEVQEAPSASGPWARFDIPAFHVQNEKFNIPLSAEASKKFYQMILKPETK